MERNDDLLLQLLYCVAWLRPASDSFRSRSQPSRGRSANRKYWGDGINARASLLFFPQ